MNGSFDVSLIYNFLPLTLGTIISLTPLLCTRSKVACLSGYFEMFPFQILIALYVTVFERFPIKNVFLSDEVVMFKPPMLIRYGRCILYYSMYTCYRQIKENAICSFPSSIANYREKQGFVKSLMLYKHSQEAHLIKLITRGNVRLSCGEFH